LNVNKLSNNVITYSTSLITKRLTSAYLDIRIPT